MANSPRAGVEPRLFATIVFPTDRATLLERALELNAPDAVRVAIGLLPNGAIGSRAELVAAIERMTSA
jgi:hypothetical protein